MTSMRNIGNRIPIALT